MSERHTEPQDDDEECTCGMAPYRGCNVDCDSVEWASFPLPGFDMSATLERIAGGWEAKCSTCGYRTRTKRRSKADLITRLYRHAEARHVTG